MARHERVLIEGQDGNIEVFVETKPAGSGIVLIAHPHPLYGGTADNKVVTTLARAFREAGCHTVRPNFRGVGASEGRHDHGQAETTDLLTVRRYAINRFGTGLPLFLAGFSFGAYVVTKLARRLTEASSPPQRLVLVGTAAGSVAVGRNYEPEAVPPDTIVIHGADDTTVPLANVLKWAEPLGLYVRVVPGADHFFHRKLMFISRIISDAWKM